MRRQEKFLYKIMFAMLSLVLGVLVISCTTLFFINYRNEKQTTITFTNRLLAQVDRSVNNYIEGIKSLFDAALEDPLIASYFETEQTEKRAVSEKLEFLASTRQDLSHLFLLKGFAENRLQLVCQDPDATINPYHQYAKSLWYQTLIGQNRDLAVTSSYVQNLLEGSYEWVVSLGRKIVGEDGSLLGVMLIDLRYGSLIELCQNAMPEKFGYVFVMDDQGNLVYHPKQQLIYSGLYAENTDLVSHMQSGSFHEKNGKIYLASDLHETNWRVAGVISVGALYEGQRNLVWFFLATAVGFGALAVACSYFASKRVTKPVRELEQTVRQVQSGDLSAKANIVSSDEIGKLAQSFNEMTDRIAELMEKFEREQIAKRESILWALRAQINPHFLYNTLDSIIWMSEAGKTEDVVEMTSALAKMLRASLSRDAEKATVKVELENVTNYLRIQQYRYRKKLHYEIDVPEELYDRRIVHLSLQPLVENAIYHGIRSKPEGGTVKIRAWEEQDLLWVSVEDDGLGMTEERIQEVLNGTQQGNHIGIANVQSRIHLMFGESYGLRMESSPGVGTKIIMKLPNLRRKDET